MDDPYSSDPDDVLDQHELEIALYSQVHFDPGPGCESWNEKTENILSLSNHRPFHIEVKNLTAKISTVKPCQPSPTGDFIAFSEEKSCKKAKKSVKNINVDSVASCSKTKMLPQAQGSQKDLKSSLTSPVLFEIDKKGSTNSVTVVSDSKINDNEKESQGGANKSSKSNKNLNAQSDTSDSVDTKSITTKGSVVKKEKQIIPAKDSNKGKEEVTKTFTIADKFLPFKMTKTNLGKSEEIIPKRDSSTEHLDKTIEETSKQTKQLPKLGEFLHLSKSDNNIAFSKAKKKVTKLDAAVQIRKPTVCVRRPPVVVKYKQDSDTDTDYSDSECSNLASPVKPFTKTTAGKQVVMVSSTDDSSGSQQPKLSTAESKKGDACTKESDDCIVVEEGGSDDGKAEDSLEESSSSSSQVSTDEEESESGEIVTSSEEDSPLDVTPNLEFNIEGGISALLSASTSPAEGEWKIDQRDRYKKNSTSSRYFSPLRVQCRNCKVEGHLSRDCPKPLKKKCAYCAQEGHVYQACPNAVCFNCETPGHRNTDCPEPRRNWNVACRRCLIYGHNEKLCPDRWRQYHLSTDPNHVNTQSETSTNDRVYCYNCASEGHFGHDCSAVRMNKFVPASFPLIAHYDKGQFKIRLSRKEKRMKHREDKLTHKLKRKHSRTEVDKDSLEGGKRLKKRSKGKDKGKSKAQPRDDSFPQTRKSQSGPKLPQSSAKRHKNEPKPSFETSRKRQFENVNDFEDLQEDFTSHQVHNNEWWNKQPAGKRVKRRDQGIEYHADYDFQSRNQMRETDRRNNSSRPYTDYSPNPLWEREYRQMGQPSPRQAQFMRGRNSQQISPLLPEPRAFFRPGNGPSPRGLNHSQSWPNMIRPKNKGGFGFQNEEFARLKNNFDRNRYQSNW